jgi:hypothetical protein
MTIYSFELPAPLSLRVTFGDAPPRINAATGMTFMTAACGIDGLLTQNPCRRMRLPVNASIQPVIRSASNHVTQIKTVA